MAQIGTIGGTDTFKGKATYDNNTEAIVISQTSWKEAVEFAHNLITGTFEGPQILKIEVINERTGEVVQIFTKEEPWAQTGGTGVSIDQGTGGAGGQGINLGDFRPIELWKDLDGKPVLYYPNVAFMTETAVLKIQHPKKWKWYHWVMLLVPIFALVGALIYLSYEKSQDNKLFDQLARITKL